MILWTIVDFVYNLLGLSQIWRITLIFIIFISYANSQMKYIFLSQKAYSKMFKIKKPMNLFMC